MGLTLPPQSPIKNMLHSLPTGQLGALSQLRFTFLRRLESLLCISLTKQANKKLTNKQVLRKRKVHTQEHGCWPLQSEAYIIVFTTAKGTIWVATRVASQSCLGIRRRSQVITKLGLQLIRKNCGPQGSQKEEITPCYHKQSL